MANWVKLTNTDNKDVFANTELVVIVTPVVSHGSRLYYAGGERCFVDVKESVEEVMKAIRADYRLPNVP